MILFKNAQEGKPATTALVVILPLLHRETSLHGMLAWYGSSSAADKKALQRVIKTEQQNITKQQLLPMDDIFTSCCLQKTNNNLKDSYHTAHNLFELLPSGKW